MTDHLGFGEDDVFARAFGYTSQGRYIEDFPQVDGEIEARLYQQFGEETKMGINLQW